jgi:hypothetical protein
MRAVRIVTLPTRSWLLASSACLSLLASTDARADNSVLGLYVGAGAGYSNINQYFNNPNGGPTYFPSDRTGWKLLVGVRPLSWLGSELEYMDSGGAHVGPYTDVAGGLTVYNQLYGADGHFRAGTLFSVGYLPLHLSWMDVFGKVGVSHAWTSSSYAGNFPNTYINCQTTCVPLGQVSISESAHSTGLAYGGGVQLHFGQLSARVEYEGINWKLAGDPYLASFVVTWKL